jgi:hypothetical protein
MIVRFVANVLAAIFKFASGILRNARTFHPDGRTFLGTVTAETSDEKLLCVAKLLEGRVLMRIGMGLVKRSTSGWIRERFPTRRAWRRAFRLRPMAMQSVAASAAQTKSTSC